MMSIFNFYRTNSNKNLIPAAESNCEQERQTIFNGKHFSICSGVSCVFSLIIFRSLVLLWEYWSDFLTNNNYGHEFFNFERNCSRGECKCILFCRFKDITTYVGGETLVCRISIFGWLTIAIVFLALAITYFNTSVSEESQAEQRNPAIVFPIKVKLLSLVILMVLFFGAMVLATGFLETCQNNIYFVNEFLKSSGDLANLIFNRLSCAATFDFLDYLHEDEIYPKSSLPQYHGEDRIHTAYMLILSIVLSWIMVIIWSFVSIFLFFDSYLSITGKKTTNLEEKVVLS